MAEKQWRYQKEKRVNYPTAQEDEYAFEYCCRNCGGTISLFIKKGVSVVQIKGEVACQHCGVRSL